MTALRLGALIAAVVLTIGALVCVRDAVQLYREAPYDPLFKFPIGVAIFLIVIVIVLVQFTGVH